MRNTLRLFLPLLLLVLLVAACGDTGNTTNNAGNQTGNNAEGIQPGEPLTGTEDTDLDEPLTGTEGTDVGEPVTGTGTGMMNKVSIMNFAFDPVDLTVAVGDTVTWTNNDTVPHTVTAGTPDSPTGEFDSGEIQPGETFSYTFDTAGTFAYFCTLHPEMMASVTVE